jgi:hypothetical protein
MFSKIRKYKKEVVGYTSIQGRGNHIQKSWPAYPQLEPNSVMDGVNVTIVNYCKTKGSFDNKVEHNFLKI